jgi:pimeloyl-ACP methyl ester carboxylesterase
MHEVGDVSPMNRRLSLLVSSLTLAAAATFSASDAHASGTIGTTLPADFPVILDATLGTPLLGFGAPGHVHHVPVIFVHGNNDTPFPTACNPFGAMQGFAQYLADNGYSSSELWALGYQGDQCDLAGDETIRSSTAHTATANVPDLRRFVDAVLRYTGAPRVDIVAHSLGSVVVREWLRQDPLADLRVRKFVSVDGANHGIINCSPSPANFYQLPSQGGFVPSSAVCTELGSPNTPFLKRLNEPFLEDLLFTETLVMRNSDRAFVYFSVQDGPYLPPVPAEDSFGVATDFSGSAKLPFARQEIDLTNQGIYDAVLGSSHLGILESPDTHADTLAFLLAPERF